MLKVGLRPVNLYSKAEVIVDQKANYINELYKWNGSGIDS